MKALVVLSLTLIVSLSARCSSALADSYGDTLAEWLNERGQQVWGEQPERCDDLTFARRVYLDVIGRVPSVSELRDFQDAGSARRADLVNQLVFGEGERAATYRRLSANHFGRQWQRVLVPPGTTTNGSPESITQFLSEQYREGIPYNELMSELTALTAQDGAGNYYQLIGGSPENYAGHISRVSLGVRVECAQCHDHPFNEWKQSDFWGLAAFYGNQDAAAVDPTINYEGTVYPAKLLFEEVRADFKPGYSRSELAEWMTARENPYFASTGVNRFWQMLVGRGMYPDVENLDQATTEERELLDEFGQRFADDGFNMQRITAAICKSAWYQAVAVGESEDESTVSDQFTRTLKVVSPDQVFDSLEQALLLSVSRIDPQSPRWTGSRMQMVSRLSETIGATPEDYASGIPQALMLMNGKLTSDAIDFDRSRLLRAVTEAPFFNNHDRIRTLYLAVLTREPTADEVTGLTAYLESKTDNDRSQNQAYGEILWALLNSPEFVLCR